VSQLVKFAVASAVVVLTAACGSEGSSDDGEGEPALGKAISVADVRTVSLPLDEYRNTHAEGIARAESILANKCLRTLGITYALPVAAPPTTLISGVSRRYGLADSAEAATRGYHLPEGAGPQAGPGSGPQEEAPVSPEVESALTGRGQNSIGGKPIPEGGCLGQARATLAEGAPAQGEPMLAERLAGEALQRTNGDSRVAAKNAEWSACMKGAGFNYADPMKTISDPAFAGDSPSPAEIATAKADVACKDKVGLVATMVQVETAYQQRALEANAEVLKSVKAAQDAMVRNAQKVVAGG